MVKPLIVLALVAILVILLLQTCSDSGGIRIVEENTIVVTSHSNSATWGNLTPDKDGSVRFEDSHGNEVVIPHATTISLPRR